MTDKNTLRSQIKNTDISDRAYKDAVINCILYESDIYQYADELFLFCGIGHEPDLKPIALNALMDGKKVAYPVSINKTEMIFRYITDFENDFATGAFGIKEPEEGLEEAGFRDAADRIIICPGMAFDHEGRRLGRGNGYYDRFLGEYGTYFSSVTGVCYSEFILPEIPSDEHDITMDYILTEQEWIK